MSQLGLLLRQEPALANIKDRNQKSILHLAVEKGDPDVVDVLLRHKARIEELNPKRQTPLYVAVEKNHPEVVRRLLAGGANPLITEEDGQTLIHLVAKTPGDNVDVLSVLMGTAIDKNAKEKAHGRTALMMALESGMQQVAIYLLEHNCDLSITDTYGNKCQAYTKDKELQERIAQQHVTNELKKRGFDQQQQQRPTSDNRKGLGARKSTAHANAGAGGGAGASMATESDENGFRLEKSANSKSKEVPVAAPADHGIKGLYNQREYLNKKVENAEAKDTGSSLLGALAGVGSPQSTTDSSGLFASGTQQKGIFTVKSTKLKEKKDKDKEKDKAASDAKNFNKQFAGATPENTCSWGSFATFCILR